VKIRDGFVSNSSSTSYLIIATKKAFDDTFQKILDKSGEAKPIAKELIKTAKTLAHCFKIGGQEMRHISISTGEVYENKLELLENKIFEMMKAKEPVRGCEHELPIPEAKFCPECGQEAYVERFSGEDAQHRAEEIWHFFAEQLSEHDESFVEIGDH